MKTSRAQVLFWCLIVVQFAGMQMILWGGLPIYQGLLNFGHRAASAADFEIAFAAVTVMQVAHWPAVRLRQALRIPAQRDLGPHSQLAR